MIPTIVGSLVVIKKRKILEIFPPRLRLLWKDWELRVMVLLSLALQVLLITLGNRRKYVAKPWIRALVWTAYLMADWIATVALGVLSNNLGDLLENNTGKEALLDADSELTALWAPFLLLHLGGPDTITAYSLEDNELWLRHMLGLIVQTVIALYIFLMAWNGSHLSILTIPMFVAGLIKYGERTWVLWSASNERFRDSMLDPPDPGPNYPKFMEEYTLKQFEGFHVMTDEVIEAQVPVNLSSIRTNYSQDATHIAYDLFQTFRRLFAGLILSFQHRDQSQSLFKGFSFEDAFKVSEIELGFMYDVLYTKAILNHSFIGFALRFISLSCTFFVSVLFSFSNKQKYSKVDLNITFSLMGSAIFLEIYSVFLLLSSDWTDVHLGKHLSVSVRRALTFLRFLKYPRWSNSITQYSLLSYCIKERSLTCCNIEEWFCIGEMLKKHRYRTYKTVSREMKELIYEHLKEKYEFLISGGDIELKGLCTCRGNRALGEYPDLDWSSKVEFDQSILIWHIATDICYYTDKGKITNPRVISKCKISKQISRYMLSILVMYPFLLPIGIGMIRYRDTCAEATKFFEERKTIMSKNTSKYYELRNGCCCTRGNCLSKRKLISTRSQACKLLLTVNTEVPPTAVKGDRSKSVLFDACRLATELQVLSDEKKKWEMISNVWVEMLAYAASQCRGNYHAQQLRRGGELLTHVWLLMAHLGLTEQIQISQGHARAKLIVR